MFAAARDHRDGRDRALPRRRPRRAPPRRRPLAQSGGISVSTRSSPTSSSSSLGLVVLVVAVAPRHEGARGIEPPPGSSAVAVARPRRLEPPDSTGRQRRAEPGRQRRAEPGARRADRRPRVHPECPVRPVLPRRPGRLLHARPASMSSSRTRSTPDLVTLVGQGVHRRRAGRWHERHPGRQPGHPDQVRGHDLRPVPVDRVREGIDRDQDGGRPRGEEGRDPGAIRVVVDHAPGAARRRRPHARGRRDRRVPRLRPGCRRGPGRGRLPRPGSRTTSPSSWS